MVGQKHLKVRVPRNKIPPVYPLCPSCGKGTKQMFGAPHAEGYHRRHKCQDIMCDFSFYTLTPYIGEPGVQEIAVTPFKDRALTELEQLKRDRWWDEANSTVEDTPFLDIPARMARAIHLDEEERDDIDSYLAWLHAEATQEVQRLLHKEKDIEQ